ncbi:pentatricopeptide repeat-containing protein 1, mitochondrial [Calliopsis andreniformis]|uniref:pentatricopeptide repeat-containing protein 1, mitochondrial n=1 Tax=Calliopsis andreniformis TaxID=337506 RepID=UPI003FCDC949
MFLSKTNTFLKSKVLTGYFDNYNRNNKQGRQFFFILKVYNYSIYSNTSISQLRFALCQNKNECNEEGTINVHSKGSWVQWLHFNRRLCTKNVPKDANVFGDLAYDKYEKFEMDEAEKEEERYTENDTKIPRWQKLSIGQYCKLIKSHLKKKDLQLALSVLDLIKSNRDKPTTYMYNLLIRAFASQGDIKQCFKLFNKMKKRRLMPNAATYNSLLNACSTSTDKSKALEHLHSLRQFFCETNYPLNETHYITLIKAYSWHNEIVKAFEIADLAKDNGFISNNIYAALFHATISDKQNGLKYALILWHKMRKYKVPLNITHYNLLLRAIRDTGFGDMNVNLISELLGTQIQLNETEKPDLLDFPPRLNIQLFASNVKHLPSESVGVSNDKNSELDIVNEDVVLSQSLNHILQENRLILFGGINKFLQRMESNNVPPDIKTVTMLLELLPPTTAVEQFFLTYLEKKKFELDICFFNVLIKRRCLRNQYKEAKKVMNEVQKHHLTPDIITFGVLAIGCNQFHDGKELLEQMNNICFHPNITILNILLNKAFTQYNLKYVLYLMDYMLQHEIEPNLTTFNFLETYQKSMVHCIRKENRFNRKKVKKLQEDYNKFIILYYEWKEKIQTIDTIKVSKSS